jgi:hypothetical protein
MPRTNLKKSPRQSIPKKPAQRSSSIGLEDEDNPLPELDGGEEPELTSAGLLEKAVLTTDQWYKSKNTQKGYASYVKGGKKFVEEWDKEHAEATDVEIEDGAVESTSDSPQPDLSPSSSNSLILSRVFDEIGVHTPTALQLYTAYKCELQKRTFSVAEGIRSAFKLYFER